MDKDIDEHIKGCHRCQIRKKSQSPPAPLEPLAQCTEPNQRIHADLFGPLRASGNNKMHILTITDAFTKYVEIVALENKEASTVAEALFDRWICRYGVPLDILTDGGKEFCNKLQDEMWTLLGATHLKTSPHHPQCNAQAEVFNKTIRKYLTSFVDESTLDWEQFLAPLMFSYNTSFHRTVLNTPHYLTFGVDARQPGFLAAPDLRARFYGTSVPQEQMQRLQWARRVAQANSENASQKMEQQFNQHAEPHNFQPGQLVLLSETYFLGKNAKLAPQFSGPHRILHLKGPKNVELKLKNGRKSIVSVDRIKPYKEEVPAFMPPEQEPEELRTPQTPAPTSARPPSPSVFDQGGGYRPRLSGSKAKPG
jgi:hypothetical protein